MADEPVLRPIEVGLIVVGALDRVDSEAVQQVRRDLLRELERDFPEFGWVVEVIWRPELTNGTRVAPTSLLDMAREERDGRDWDFVFVVTPSDLITHYKPFAFAAISRSVDSAVISTMRIDPRMEDPLAESDRRVAAVSRRLVVLMRHSFGHINSLESASDSQNVMGPIRTIDDLDRLADSGWSPEQRESLAKTLSLVADVRLEETGAARRKGTFQFYLKGSWINRHEIADAILRARPWEFPRRLNRLTTAAFSAAVVLMITAESWELAVHQSPFALAGLCFVSLLVTTSYITRRQKLLIRREQRISEQSVITNVSAVGVVLIGMLVTFAVTLAVVTAASLLFFHSELVQSWTGLSRERLSWRQNVCVATFVASLAVVVGALGASFEEQSYFRHITFIDEEV